MLTLINTNRMTPPIAPIGLDYLAEFVRRAGFEVEVVDLCLAPDPDAAMVDHFSRHTPDLVGLSFRNVDDCFWPGGDWFVPALETLVRRIRQLTDAPLALGGVGFSIFARHIVQYVGADFGIEGDGEQATVQLLTELRTARAGRQGHFNSVDGLIWREGEKILANRPAWPALSSPSRRRDRVDNAAYFRLGGQLGLETKRGCNRPCVYCPEPKVKGTTVRTRDPRLVADEVETLLDAGIDVLHLCDSEFNIPVSHARAVCDEFIRRRFDGRVRWYAYLAVTPFDDDLAARMRAAGCVGINFTGDSGSAAMLAAYRQAHSPTDLENTVRHCRDNRIKVMVDLLLGGPGETIETATESIRFLRRIEPDCVGAALGLRVYPNTAVEQDIAAQGPPQSNPGLRRRYEGPLDLLKPTFYIAPELGERPAALIRELIGGDPRFFEPEDEAASGTDHNYSDNRPLSDAIAAGARGAYWDILHQLK